MESILLLIPILLLASSIIIGLSSDSINKFYSGIISTSLVFSSLILSVIVLIKIYSSNDAIYYDNFYDWISINGLNIGIGYLIDKFSSIMLVVVLFISFVVHIYSIGYMKHEEDFKRFFSYIALFTFSMILLVMSNNLIQLFIGWEGVGLVSYLLIGFFYKKSSAIKANLKAFLVNRIGDMFFILGIVMIYSLLDSFDYRTMFLNLDSVNLSNLETYFGLNYIDFACLLLFIGAMGKSAQLGLHTWLPDAMEGPTPVSALIHAATMVTAGVFLVARMSPLFEYATVTNLFITFIGAATAIFAATIALTQNDIKRVIAYSTCSQLGYMFFAAGLGAYNASIFHLMTHGFFKALLFLSAGSVIHAMHHEQDMRKMGGLFKKIPFTGTMMWIGSLAIIGFPYFSGYYSKESILENAYYSDSSMATFAYTIGILTALLTAFYSWRLLFMTFHGETRSDKKTFDHAHESPFVMTLPLVLLAFGSIFMGIFFADYYIGKIQYVFWGDSLILHEGKHYYLPFIQTLIVKSSVAIGVMLAALIYFYKNNLPKNLAHNLDPLYSISLNKWYVDEFYNSIFIKPYFLLANLFWKRGDEKIIDKYGPNGISKIVGLTSNYLSRFQSGYLYHYAFAMLGGLVIILTWFIYY